MLAALSESVVELIAAMAGRDGSSRDVARIEVVKPVALFPLELYQSVGHLMVPFEPLYRWTHDEARQCLTTPTIVFSTSKEVAKALHRVIHDVLCTSEDAQRRVRVIHAYNKDRPFSRDFMGDPNGCLERTQVDIRVMG